MDLYSTDELIGMVAALDRPSAPLLTMFFPRQMEFDTEEVYIDKVDTARRLAPFVSPLVAGKAERSRGYSTRSFVPAYVKPKHVVEPAKAMKRRAGERLTGELTPMQRFDAATVDNLQIEEDQITRREEWMASQLLRTGSVTVSGEDYPAQVVDLGRNAAHTKALTGGSRWGETGISPYASLKAWAVEVAKNGGAHPGTVVMDPLACELLQKDTEVRTILDNRRQESGNFNFLPQANGAPGEEMIRIGVIGQFEIWQYTNLYTLEDGTVQNFMPDYTVIMGSRTLAEGWRLYGAIKDASALRAMARYPKQWKSEDPSAVYTMTQSSPLPILGRPDATMCATVR